MGRRLDAKTVGKFAPRRITFCLARARRNSEREWEEGLEDETGKNGNAVDRRCGR